MNGRRRTRGPSRCRGRGSTWWWYSEWLVVVPLAVHRALRTVVVVVPALFFRLPGVLLVCFPIRCLVGAFRGCFRAIGGGNNQSARCLSWRLHDGPDVVSWLGVVIRLLPLLVGLRCGVEEPVVVHSVSFVLVNVIVAVIMRSGNRVSFAIIIQL